MAISQNFPNIVPSLSLDFANVKALDPRITFTRASTATYYGTETAKAEENLLIRSQEIGAAGWGIQSGSSMTANTTLAPDGTTTADTFNEGTGTAFHDVNQVKVGFVGPFTYSCFMQHVDQQFGILSVSGNSTNFVAASFDLIAGVVTDSANFGVLTTLTEATITSVGGGWFRCTISGTVVTAGSFTFRIAISPNGPIANNQFGIGIYTGTSKSAVFWGAQLEQRSQVTAYTPTTTQPITNYIPVLESAASGVARFDHNPVTKESLGLLIEEQRTNLLLRSEEFDNASWTKADATITANTVVAPSGELTGDKLIPSSGSNTVFQQISVTSGASLTLSIYAKIAGYRYVVFRNTFAGLSGDNVSFDLQDGVVQKNVSGVTSTITPVGNGWFRCSSSWAAGATGPSNFQVKAASEDVSTSSATLTGSYNGFSGIFIWGAQLE